MSGQNTNIFEDEELQRPEALKFLIFFEKSAKKCLTFLICFVILLKLACGRPQKTSAANLENDTEKETRKKERSAKIPKSLASKDVKD